MTQTNTSWDFLQKLVIYIDLPDFFHQFVAVEIEKIGSLNMFTSLDFGVSHPWTTSVTSMKPQWNVSNSMNWEPRDIFDAFDILIYCIIYILCWYGGSGRERQCFEFDCPVGSAVIKLQCSSRSLKLKHIDYTNGYYICI